MINKIKSTKRTDSFAPKYWLLSLILFSTSIQNTFCKTITGSNQKEDKAIGSLPKIITLQTYKDWSSRLGTNQTTPQTTSLVFEESKEVRTIDHGPNQKTSTTTTEKTINEMKDTLMTIPKKENKMENKTENKVENKRENKTDPNQVNAHNIAAQVLSRIIYMTPLLALASNGVPHRRLNYTLIQGSDKANKNLEAMPSIERLNEIDVDSDVKLFKSDRMSASGISFPTTTSTTTDLNIPIYETTPTEPPSEYIEHPPHQDEEHPDQHDHQEGGEQEEDEQAPPEDHDDYEDDEELESFRYPVKVSFPEAEDDSGSERESPLPFVMPNIDLNPESLKQKGCRTVVKEVQAIPVTKGQQNLQNPNNIMKRTKRSNDDPSRKFTSIVMTKECHFPGDEGASSEESPQTLPTTAMSDSRTGVTYQSLPSESDTLSTPPSFDEYDEDFDFRPQLSYAYPDRRALIDRMEPKSSNDRRSYADNPVFRRDNSEYIPRDDFGFDDSNFYDFNEEKNKQMKKRPKPKQSRPQMSSSPSGGYDFDDEEFGPQPKSKQNSRPKKPLLYNNDRGSGGRQKGGRKKPKKINRSFAFFRKAEPKDKDPNESDYSVSYGRGNFQSFSDSYDSDRDGPRKKGKKGRRRSRDDDDD